MRDVMATSGERRELAKTLSAISLFATNYANWRESFVDFVAKPSESANEASPQTDEMYRVRTRGFQLWERVESGITASV